MLTPESWRSLFQNWPEDMERRGFVLSKQGESIGFDDFRVSNGLLLLGRNAPDASGARRAFIAFDEIALVKLPTIAELSQFQRLGFQQPGTGSAHRTISPEARTRQTV